MVKQPIKPFPSKNQAVGLDWGIAHFLTLSDGKTVGNPRFGEKYKQKLRIAQRSLSRKKKFGSNWKKQVKVVAKLHSKVARCRNDFHHKVSSQLIRDYDRIAIEGLNVKEMTQSGQSDLTRKILDSAPASFYEMLVYKAEWYGRELIKVKAEYSSQECSKCGHTTRENRKSQSVFKCVSCGHSENADLNAAKNIEARAFASIRQREPVGCA